MEIQTLSPIEATRIASATGKAVTFISTVTGDTWTVKPAAKPQRVASRASEQENVSRPVEKRVVVEDDGDCLWAV